ncbi:ABC transporter permease [Amycolatopsis sp. NPDC004079]|uniref:ABC transporter permease n=1 Tax=Amycolatopsis sp. NPDC004079 TaxID=3154549 RepID=UPI0033B234E8
MRSALGAGWRHSPWLQFAAKRLVGLALTFALLIVVTFFIVRLFPGDPAVAAAGPDATPVQVEQVRHELGLTDSLFVQFGGYVRGVVEGNLGTSYSLRQPVAESVSARLPFTLGIALLAIVLVLIVAIPAGMAVSVLTRGGRRRWLDHGFNAMTGLVAAIPSYVMATFLVLVFAVSLALLPPAYSNLRQAQSFVLPVLGLALGPICTVSRLVRRETAVVLEQDFVRTARGWRLGGLRLYGKYALPALMTSTLTLGGLILTSMLGGAIVVETVFGWPGLGLEVVRAILVRDYPLIQGIILVLGMLAALLTLLVDVVLGLIDTRTLGSRNV